MKIVLDIENSRSNSVKSIELDVIRYSKDKYIECDLCNIGYDIYNVIRDAINDEVNYIDIELFYVDGDSYPNYGPDYKYSIIDNKLVMLYDRVINRDKEISKNIDFTYMYKREFDIIKNEFLDSDGIYLLVYLDDVLKYNILYDKPKGDIFMDLFFNKGYRGVSLYKKEKDNLIYIDSYYEE